MPQTYLASLNSALRQLFKKNGNVYLLGQDIIDPYGGSFKVTRGLSTEFPKRVIATPISESAMVGVAIGMAMRGLKPIVEIMFGDFITLCTDQIINHAAKFQSMFCNKVSVPLVIRTPMGGGRGYGPTHSQSLEKLFLGIPHLVVVAPSQFHNPGKILEYALLSTDKPVLFIEHKLLYPRRLISGESFPLSVQSLQEEAGYPIAIIKNYEEREPDVVIVSYGGMAILIEEVMRKLYKEEIRILACISSNLSSVPIEILVSLIKSCKNVIIVEEGTGLFGWSAEVSSQCYASLQNSDITIRRITSFDSVIPAARHLEDKVLPNSERLEDTIMEVIS